MTEAFTCDWCRAKNTTLFRYEGKGLCGPCYAQAPLYESHRFRVWLERVAGSWDHAEAVRSAKRALSGEKPPPEPWT